MRSPWVCQLLVLLLIITLMSGAQYNSELEGQLGRGEHPACLQREKEALLQFKQALISTLSNQSAWVTWDNAISECCSWAGVTCTTLPNATFPRVTGLSLPNLNITGPVAPPLFTLSFLHTLNLSFNHLSGSLPARFTSLSHLRILDLSFNNLSGSDFLLTSIPSLISINISSNSFTNNLPAFGNLTELQELRAQNNRFFGAIDPSICQHAPMLRTLDLSANMLDGSLGHGFGSCVHLEQLALDLNMIQGPIPQDLYSIKSLSILSLASNFFSGELHESVGNLTNLSHFSLQNNSLYGTLPKTLSKNSKLITLYLPGNHFTGHIDVNFANLTFLQELVLRNNLFSGRIPESIGFCSSLRLLHLARNFFSGSVPMQFNSLDRLESALLSTNQLSGSLQAFEDCKGLVTLIFTKNFFTAPLPLTWHGFTNLQVLALAFANLRGPLPQWLQKCRKLQVLDLSWNHLEGGIPIWLGHFPHLVYLELSNNSFGGIVPQELFELPSLVRKDDNTLPTSGSLFVIQIYKNVPDLVYGGAQVLPGTIILSNNHLIGELPSKIGHLEELMVLDLSHNLLTGSIPSSLANISSLERLDLSYNHLNGSIPSILTSLTFLADLNVSFNNLSGPIPSSNQFGTFPSSSYAGNPWLCISPNFSSCPTKTSDGSSDASTLPLSHAKSFERIIYLCVCIAVGVISFTTTLFIMATCRNKMTLLIGKMSCRQMI